MTHLRTLAAQFRSTSPLHPDSVTAGPIRRGRYTLPFLVLLILAGCGDGKPGKNAADTAGTSLDTAGATVLTDWMGETVVLKEPPGRIVSLAPNITEILYAIGVGDRVVGRTEFCNYPPAVLNVDIVADLQTLNFEKIVARKPDLVLMTHAGNLQANYMKLKELGLQPFVLHDSTINEVILDIGIVGQLVGRREEARVVVERLKREVDSIRRLAAAGPRVTAFVIIDPMPLITVSRGFISELLTTAGGENIAAGGLTAYPKYNREELLRKDPEVILFPAESMKAADELLAAYPEWRNLRAVKNNRMYVIPRETILRPGPRISEGLDIIYRALHGADPKEVFGR